MNDYVQVANSTPLYLVVGAVLLYVVFMCIAFMMKSYRAGIKLGMEKKVLIKSITSSTFTLIPSVSILLGVIALAGSLGVPTAWYRLSIVGNLQYETLVAGIVTESMGLPLNASALTMDHLVTIVLVMTIGILWGCVFSIFTLKFYANKLTKAPKKEEVLDENGQKKKGFAQWAMVAMFIGMCATFVGSYAARLVVYREWLPILTAFVAAAAMAIFQFLINKKGFSMLENFSLAGSMLISMIAAVFLNMVV